MEEIVGLKKKNILPLKVKCSHSKAKNFFFEQSYYIFVCQSAGKLVQYKFKFTTFPWNCAVNKVESIFYQKNQF